MKVTKSLTGFEAQYPSRHADVESKLHESHFRQHHKN